MIEASVWNANLSAGQACGLSRSGFNTHSDTLPEGACCDRISSWPAVYATRGIAEHLKHHENHP